MNTQAELRAFAIGCATGIAIFVGTLFVVCQIAGIRFQLVPAKCYYYDDLGQWRYGMDCK